MKCGHCKRLIRSNSWEPLYRTCDSYVCSPACSRERLKVITNLDPHLTHCMSWADTTTIAPPRTFERKVSYVTLGSLTGKADVSSDTTPLLNNRYKDDEYEKTEYDVENNNRITNDPPRRSLWRLVEETLAIVCVSAVTVGVVILLG